MTERLTSWKKVILKNLVVAQLDKFLAFWGVQLFIMFVRVHHRTLSWAS